MKYEWYRLNLFIRWISAPKRTILIIFDTAQPVVDSLQRLLLKEITIAKLEDPLWIYPVIAEEVVRLQDQAVWAIRDLVRVLEKHRAPLKNPKPDFVHLHEISRHAIHVSETLDLNVKSVRMILTRHEKLILQGQAGSSANNIHDLLLFYEQMLTSLRHRSESNKQRLVNEIQLAFNTVAQYDSRLSLKIGQAAQVDSRAMKTIAFVTLTFLPATFISAVFSMSFFDYDAGSDVWAVSNKFWWYWVVVIPITALTFLCWHLWWRNIPSEPTGAAQEVDSEVDFQKSFSTRGLRSFLRSRHNTAVV
jgi:Mg2+ and Co2+ transporter CorA